LGLILKDLFPLQLLVLNLILSVIILIYSGFRISKLKAQIAKVALMKLPELRTQPILAAFIVLALFTIINLFVLVVFQPSGSWDDYNYHLSFVADIIKTGQIRNFADPFIYTVSYPHNIEMFNLWHMIFFRDDFLVEITNFSFLIFTSIVVYALCRYFKATKKLAAIGALLVFSIPMYLLLAKTTKVDIAIWALFGGVIYLSLQVDFKKLFAKRNLIIFIGLCSALGIIFGSKTTAIIYVLAAVLGIFILQLTQTYRQKFYFKKLIATAFILSIALLLLGSFWYFRAWFYYGNPIYPVAVNFLGIHLPGTLQNIDFANGIPQIQSRNFFQRLIYVWQERDAWFQVYYISDSKIGGLGPVWYVFLLPAWITSMLVSYLKRNWKFLLVVLLPLLVFVAVPGDWIVHYSGFIAIFGIVALIYLLNVLLNRRAERVIIYVFLLLLFAYSFMLTLQGSYYPTTETIKKIFNRQQNIYAKTYKAPAFNIFINTNTGPGDKIVIGKIWFPYSLYNHNFSNDLILLLADKGGTDWLNQLKLIKPKYVVVMANSAEYDAVLQNQHYFTKLVTDSDGPHYLYSFNY
jgi:hypothetical protein